MIKPDYLTLDELLSKRLFRIPDYQRAYSWKNDHRSDLFNDIKKLREKIDDNDRSHFLATIVLMRTKEREEVGPDEFIVYDVVDGQQRLTTIVILLKAITKLLLTSSNEQQRYGADLQGLLVKRENDRLILLQTNHESAHEFRRYLIEGLVPRSSDVRTTGQKNLVDAFNECEVFVREWKHGPTDLLRLIKNRLAVVNYVLEDQASAYTIFEVLNSRGLLVDSLDKCKSMLMALTYESFAKEERDEFANQVQQLWSALYREIGVDEIPGNEILRFSAALLSEEPQGKIMSDDEALYAIRQSCLHDPRKIIATVTKFVEVAKILKSLNARPALGAVVSNRQSRFIYSAIMSTIKFTDAEKEKILNIWEKVTFLIYGIFRRDTRYEVGALVKLGWRISNEDLHFGEVLHDFNEIGIKYMDERRSIMNELGDIDCYNQWQESLRYLLFKYEEHLAEQAGYALEAEVWDRIWEVSASKSIEHILPQDVDAIGWKGKFGTTEEAKSTCHRLGNLVLVPPVINSKLWKHSFEKKKEIYAECSHLRMIRELTTYDDWNPSNLEDRELKILEWAEKNWKIVELDSKPVDKLI